MTTLLRSSLSLAALTVVLACLGQARAQPANGRPEPLLVLSGHQGEVFTVAYSPDGKLLASASNREVKVWDAATGKEVFNYAVKGTNVFGLAFRPDGKVLAVGISKQVKMLDTATGQEVQTINGAAHFLFRLSFSPDGKRLAASGGSLNQTGAVCVWDAEGKEALRLPGQTDAVLTTVFSSDGRLLASGSGGTTGPARPGTVKVWDAGTGNELLALPGHTENVYAVAFSPDGRRLVSAGGGLRNSTRPGQVKLWELLSGQEVLEFNGHTAPVFAAVFSPDGRLLATAGGDRAVNLWDVASGEDVERLTAHTSTVFSLAFSPDGKRLASASQDKTVLVWDVSAVRPKKAARAPTERELAALWTDLSGTPARAHRSVGTLADFPERTVPLLKDRLRPAPFLEAGQAKQAERWIRDLDDEEFTVREKAETGLAQLGEAVLPALRRARTTMPSLEAHRRIDRLIEALSGSVLTSERMAALRGVEVLERIGSVEARGVLKTLADGLPEARLTREAQASLERLGRK
jgi:WD40 repeat protein